jgi:signal transduction histidine kinase
MDDIQENEKEEAAKPKLSISSHVVVQLGSELVTDVEQALLELAKNAYDADSDTCEITVDPDWILSPDDPVYDLLFPSKEEDDRKPAKVGRLLVQDYGGGIPESAVDLGWLRISSSLKRAAGEAGKAKTKRNRVPVGDKGLGRLATMKIGTVLRLKTAIEGETLWRTVSFSWADFTPNRTLDQVTVLKRLDSEAVKRAGTIIEIIGLHEPDQWRQASFIERELVPNLSSLISPFQSQDNFSINVKVGLKTYELETLHDDVLNLASAKFAFSWDGRKLRKEAWIASSLFRGSSSHSDQDRFDTIFDDINRPKLLAHLLSDTKLNDKGATANVVAPWLLAFCEESDFSIFPADKAYPGGVNPGPFKAEIYSFLFSKATKDKLQQAGMSAAQMQAMANIALYRDGFRVRAQKDWLRLSESSTKGGSFYELRPSNVLGYFALSNEFNHGLIEKSDREGFVDNRELRGFMALSQRCKDYANTILETTRRSVNEFSAQLISKATTPPSAKVLADRLESAESSSKQDIKRAKSTLAKAMRQLSEARVTLNSQPTGELNSSAFVPFDSASADLTKSLQALEAIEEKLNEHGQLSGAMRLVRLSDDEQKFRLIDAAAVGLSARSLSHELHHYVRQLREGVSIIAERNKSLRDEKIREATRQLNSVSRELSKIIASIDPLLPGSRSLKENICLHEFLQEFIRARRTYAQSKGVDSVLKISSEVNDLTLRFSRSRLLQIIENLFQNSIYWLTRGPISSTERQIVIEATNSGFTWSDTGPGISPNMESSIFDPFVSDKPSSEGQGLGLHIVSTFLEAERCSIELSGDRNTFGRRYKFILNLVPSTGEHKQPRLFPAHG